MIDFSEENKQCIKRHLVQFFNCTSHEHNKGVAIDEVADRYVDNEISMQKAMKEYYDYLKEESEKNHRLLLEIKKDKGSTFYKYLIEIINESEGIKGVAQIVDKPVGEFQKEKYGRQIKGIWVDQRSVGDSGDSWEGTVCVQPDKSRYLKLGYSM